MLQRAGTLKFIIVCAGSSAPSNPDVLSWLSPKSADDMARIGESLRNTHIDVAVCSFAIRAQGTLATILHGRAVETHAVPFLYFESPAEMKLLPLSRRTPVPTLESLHNEYGLTLRGHAAKAERIREFIPHSSSSTNWTSTILIVGHPILLPNMLWHLFSHSMEQESINLRNMLYMSQMGDGALLEVVVENGIPRFERLQPA
jgi:hypothetical protein